MEGAGKARARQARTASSSDEREYSVLSGVTPAKVNPSFVFLRTLVPHLVRKRYKFSKPPADRRASLVGAAAERDMPRVFGLPTAATVAGPPVVRAQSPIIATPLQVITPPADADSIGESRQRFEWYLYVNATTLKSPDFTSEPFVNLSPRRKGKARRAFLEWRRQQRKPAIVGGKGNTPCPTDVGCNININDAAAAANNALQQEISRRHIAEAQAARARNDVATARDREAKAQAALQEGKERACRDKEETAKRWQARLTELERTNEELRERVRRLEAKLHDTRTEPPRVSSAVPIVKRPRSPIFDDANPDDSDDASDDASDDSCGGGGCGGGGSDADLAPAASLALARMLVNRLDP